MKMKREQRLRQCERCGEIFYNPPDEDWGLCIPCIPLAGEEEEELSIIVASHGLFNVYDCVVANLRDEE
jgi:formylmethanofuran dehydrogenase subunit E